jgi:hypothetical protein
VIPKRLVRPRPPRAAVVEDGAGLLGGRDPLAVFGLSLEARDLVVDGARFRLRPMVPHGRDSAAPHAGDADRGGGEIVDAVFFIVCVCVGGFKSDTSSVRGSAESSSFGIHCGVTNLILVLPRSAPQQGPLVVLVRRRPGLGRCRALRLGGDLLRGRVLDLASALLLRRLGVDHTPAGKLGRHLPACLALFRALLAGARARSSVPATTHRDTHEMSPRLTQAKSWATP